MDGIETQVLLKALIDNRYRGEDIQCLTDLSVPFLARFLGSPVQQP